MKFVFDLDGTICFKGKPLSVGIINALEACRQSGHASMFLKAKESVCVGNHQVGERATLQVPSEEAAIIEMLSHLSDKYK
ncbi:HAD family hydrolase [Lysinibacillus fusiformis]|uniref:HAD family hydrolase n=1 Tax=Lysinibacillus fusiformis TaxID=28031 RepID=UPI001E5715A4|nr:HAD family hydrolase [Lysinibacillus fusiformis]